MNQEKKQEIYTNFTAISTLFSHITLEALWERDQCFPLSFNKADIIRLQYWQRFQGTIKDVILTPENSCSLQRSCVHRIIFFSLKAFVRDYFPVERLIEWNE